MMIRVPGTESVKTFGQTLKARKKSVLLLGIKVISQPHGPGEKKCKRIKSSDFQLLNGLLIGEGSLPPSVPCRLFIIVKISFQLTFSLETVLLPPKQLGACSTWPHVIHCFSQCINMTLVYNVWTPSVVPTRVHTPGSQGLVFVPA